VSSHETRNTVGDDKIYFIHVPSSFTTAPCFDLVMSSLITSMFTKRQSIQ
jgi:hypothetical protein